MIGPERDGTVQCQVCGTAHHFGRPCLPALVGKPLAAPLLPPVDVRVGEINAAVARAEADVARTAARGPVSPQCWTRGEGS